MNDITTMPTCIDGEVDLRYLRAAEVSPEFLAVARFDSTDIGVGRNSAAEAAHKALRGAPDSPSNEDVQKYVDGVRLELAAASGGFAAALYAGDLAEAFVRADTANSRILCHLFSQEYVRSCNDLDSRMMDNAIIEKYERHGPLSIRFPRDQSPMFLDEVSELRENYERMHSIGNDSPEVTGMLNVLDAILGLYEND